ncbi:MAG TPA: hypothetical protein VGM56_29860, partial [Byssovorax sp.]
RSSAFAAASSSCGDTSAPPTSTSTSMSSAATTSAGGADGASASASASTGSARACSDCDGLCVDLDHDPSHCGRCDHACDDAAPECVAGACVVPACTSLFPCPHDHTCCGDSCCPPYAVCCADEATGALACVSAPDGGAVACPSSCCAP